MVAAAQRQVFYGVFSPPTPHCLMVDFDHAFFRATLTATGDIGALAAVTQKYAVLNGLGDIALSGPWSFIVMAYPRL